MPGFLPDSDSEDELPPGWEEKATIDGHVYYINNQSKATQWVHPRTGKAKKVSGELPFGWEKSIDEQSNRLIFTHSSTNQTTYTDPRLAFATEEPPMSIKEVRQRFDSSSTALQILHGIDLSGKLAVITGANGGIGLETATSLAMHGCEVIMACRNQKATEEAIQAIYDEQVPTARMLRFMLLDLSSLKSVKNFADELKRTVQHVDFLILNAGVFGLSYSLTEDGIETTFQVCHLSHFYLTLQLESLLDFKSRVVVLSSESHRYANLPGDHLSAKDLSPPASKYRSMMAYNNAKLCNLLFTKQLAEKWRNRGISVFAVHPGNFISTGISRHWWCYRLLFALARPFTKTLQEAAATSVYCAVAPELHGISGMYFNNCFFCEPSKKAQKRELGVQMWKLSENMIQTILENWNDLDNTESEPKEEQTILENSKDLDNTESEHKEEQELDVRPVASGD